MDLNKVKGRLAVSVDVCIWGGKEREERERDRGRERYRERERQRQRC